MIDFVANGFSSWAVIKVGSLTLISKATIAGHVCYIVNEDWEICIGENTGIHFDNNFLIADPKKGGWILIPYGTYKKSCKVILSHNGFSQLADFEQL